MTQATARTQRVDSIDILRGLVMVVMALDHTRDFFGPYGFAPENLDRTTPLLFFTRWITHFCAPVFVFLAGTSAHLYGRRRDRSTLSRFLFTRGCWLIVVELVIVNLSWAQCFYANFWFVQVIWAIGWSMICLAGLIFLPRPALAAFSVAMIAGHNLLDGIAAPDGPWGHLWGILHVPHWIPIGGTGVYVVYPLIPWIGVMALGYLFGGSVTMEPERRRRIWLIAGLSASALFVVVRFAGLYGDPRAWAAQERGSLFTVMSFLNTTKYPPSLLFLLMTLGPALVALSALDRSRVRIVRLFTTYGRVPFFFYVLHIPLLHLMAIVWSLARYGEIGHWTRPASAWPSGYEPSLIVVYVVWVIAVLALYPACRWFGALKQRRRDWWVSYL